jgi:hypothetical protein
MAEIRGMSLKIRKFYPRNEGFLRIRSILTRGGAFLLLLQDINHAVGRIILPKAIDWILVKTSILQPQVKAESLTIRPCAGSAADDRQPLRSSRLSLPRGKAISQQ